MQNIVIKSYETRKSILIPIIFLLIGLILFINPKDIVEFISYIFGGVFLALGASKLFRDLKRVDKTTGDMFYSGLMIVIGLIFICCSGTIEFIIRLIIGVWILINGINASMRGLSIVRVNSKNVLVLLSGIILIILGLYTILVSNLVFQSIGLVLIIYSVLELVNCIYLNIKR